MHYSFSSEFLKVVPPATNFGEAWENLCLCLLRAETSDRQIMRLGPPDRGIDIYRQATQEAYQCKSNERGVFGTIDAQECVSSLTRAVDARIDIPWAQYSLALNAPLSGVGLSRINQFAALHELPTVSVLPPEYWSDLCDRHTVHIRQLFDYRVFVSETDVIEALRKARYYDNIVKQAAHQIKTSPLDVVVSNNRTLVELSLPFSGELTIGQLLDVMQSLLGISLEWANFPDLGTSCGPSVSMTIDRKPQPLSRRLSELTPDQRAQLQLWIKLVWRNKLQEDGDRYDGTSVFFNLILPRTTEQASAEREIRDITLRRMELLIQESIWRSVVGRPR